MGVTVRSASVRKLDCGLTAKHQKYIQDAAGQEGLIAKVFSMAGIQHCEGKASTACQTSSVTSTPRQPKYQCKRFLLPGHSEYT